MITQCKNKLDPVGSTVRYEVVELCTGTLWDNNGCYLAVLSQYEALIATVCVWSNHLLVIIFRCIYLKSLCYSVSLVLFKIVEVEVVFLLVLLHLLLIHLLLLRLPILAEGVLVGIHGSSSSSNNNWNTNTNTSFSNNKYYKYLYRQRGVGWLVFKGRRQ